MLEAILSLIGEFLLQLLLEALAELGFHCVRETVRPQPNPLLATLGYLLLGLIAGGLSLLVVPHFLVNEDFRKLNLALAPVLAGFAMMALGAWRQRRGQELVRLDRFFYGYLFALTVAAIRFQFAQ